MFHEKFCLRRHFFVSFQINYGFFPFLDWTNEKESFCSGKFQIKICFNSVLVFLLSPLRGKRKKLGENRRKGRKHKWTNKTKPNPKNCNKTNIFYFEINEMNISIYFHLIKVFLKIIGNIFFHKNGHCLWKAISHWKKLLF